MHFFRRRRVCESSRARFHRRASVCAVRCTKSCARLGTTAGWIPRSRRRLHRFGSRRFARARSARRFRQPWLRSWTLRLSRSNLLPQFEARRTHDTEAVVVVNVVGRVVVALRRAAVVGVVVPVAAAQQTVQGHFRDKATDTIRRTSIFGTDPAARTRTASMTRGLDACLACPIHAATRAFNK